MSRFANASRRRLTGSRSPSFHSSRNITLLHDPTRHLLLLALSTAGLLRAQEAPACGVSWAPAVPRAGTLFRVLQSTSLASELSDARVAGEPLHFHTDGARQSAMAAVPIDSTQGVALIVRCSATRTDTVRIPTVQGDYRLERLRVAPRFVAPPDSATAARMAREAEAAARVSREAHATPKLWTAPFVVPRASRITSGFGGGRTFNGSVTSRHMGTDFAGTVGAPVYAANRGIVRLVSALYLGGNVIYLDHGDGVVTAYLHLSKQLVQEGDTVARGALIGRVGATGRVTGPHLHFIARFGTITTDPASLLPIDRAAASRRRR